LRHEGDDASAVTSSSASPLLSVEGVSVRVPGASGGGYLAVEDVSFVIERGETVALVGESGSGKSLTTQAILGLLPRGVTLERGIVRLDGAEIVSATRRMSRGVRGTKIGAVFQDPLSSLNPTMRVGEQIAELYRVHRGLSRRQASLNACEALGEAGIADARDTYARYPHELSGGQRQRVMIAMALALHPSLMIADEPTTALDLTIQAQIVELLVRLRSEHGLAVLLITHDLALVAEVAKRVIVMYAGHVMEEGPLRSIYEDAHNPYTRALLNSTPSGMGESEMAVAPIPGSPPSPANRGSGCAFATRCYMATELCSSKRPPLAPVAMDDGVESSSRTWKSACHYRDAVREPSRA
jgi:oligopeptide/dipeptide ABC transporter ATP-binding protein